MWVRVLCVLFSFFILNPSVGASDQSTMGDISFPATIKPDAEPFFISGVLFLHNFDYEKARQQFQTAEKLDPVAPLPYWGEAMTYNHPLWDEVDVEAGRQVLKKLGNTSSEQLAKGRDAKEKGFIQALQALYGDGDKATRDKNYLQAMYTLYQRNFNDQEIASFYALALLGSTEGQRDAVTFMRAAAIAEDVARNNPKHPGAMHYAIHSLDDPIHAPLGLYYAREYSKIAASAPHALHMPSHIYLALGMWNDVIASNKRAWEAGLQNNAKADPTKYTIHDFHALQWLSYGYLQTKDFTRALQCVKSMEKLVEKNPTPMAKWYYALMRSAYIIESQDWQSTLKHFNMQGVELNAFANDLYVNSLIQLRNATDNIDLSQVIANLEQLCKAIPNKLPTHCGTSDYFTSVTSAGITAGKIIILELKAHVALKKKAFSKAISLLKEAALLEEGLPFGYGPPSPVKPAYELLADVYLENKDYLAAYHAYQKALNRAPNRTLSQVGYQNTLAILKKQHIKVTDEQSASYFNRFMFMQQE